MPTDEEYLDPGISKEIELLTRQKVIRQLHDGLTQTVSALAMRINFARRLIATDPEAAGQELEKVEQLTREATKEIRHVIFLLQPQDQEGFELIPSLEAYFEKMASLYGLMVEFEVDQDLVDQLAAGDQFVVYSIVEEALDLVRKGTASQKVSISLTQRENHLVQLKINHQQEKKETVQLQELEIIENYAFLIKGSVITDDEAGLVRVLFPLNQSDSPGN
jgi:signal transduction histidine kinase